MKWLCGVLLLCACETTRPCRTLTLLVTVALDDVSVQADRVDVDVTIDGTPSKTNNFTHTPGDAQGSIEIDAPLGDVGLASGTQMGTVGGATDEGNPVTGLIVDTAAGGGSWTLGTTSCLG